MSKPGKFSTLPIERKIQRSVDRFFTWLFSYKLRKPSPKSKIPARPTDSKLQQQLAKYQYLNPIQWVRWSVDFAVAYLLTRPLLSFIPALPAASLLLAVLLLSFQLGRSDTSIARQQAYELNYAKALQQEDLAQAVVCNRTLLDLDPNNIQYQFQRAELEQRLDHPQKARDIMHTLALSRGSPQAATWLIENDYQLSNLQAWPPAKHASYQQLIRILISEAEEPASSPSRLQLAKYYQRTGDSVSALAELEPILATNPQQYEFALELAQQCPSQDIVSRILPAAKRYFREQLADTPDDTNNQLQLAIALDLSREYTAADRLLLEICRSTSNPERRHEARGLWLQRLERLAVTSASPNNILERLNTLHQLALYFPEDASVMKHLNRIVGELECSPDLYAALSPKNGARAVDRDSLPLPRYLVSIVKQDDADSEDRELAYRQGIDLPMILNNLALATASGPQRDLQRALDWAEAAIEEFPVAYYFKTRGEILFSLKRYRESGLDLEKAISLPELEQLLRAKLEAVYRLLNDSMHEPPEPISPKINL